jgi:hypothetical protein
MEKNETSKNEKIVKKSENPSNVIFFYDILFFF